MAATQTPATVGDRLPSFSLPLISGGDLNMDNLRGKRLLLFFWGSW